MPAEKKEELVYVCERAVTLPLSLGFSILLREAGAQILKVTVFLQDVQGEAVDRRIKVHGRLNALVRYSKPDGRLVSLPCQSAFDSVLPLEEELPSGHLELAAIVQNVSYSLSTALGQEARLEVRVQCELGVKVMRVQTPAGILPEELPWVPLVLPELLAQEETTSFRELLLPLDPPALKVLRAEVHEGKVQAEFLPGLVVSGEAEETVLYLGRDERVHLLRHVTRWSRFLPAKGPFENAGIAAWARGQVAKEVLQADGHTLRLHVAETVGFRVKRERKLQVLTCPGPNLPAETVRAKVRRVVAETATSELFTLPLTLPEPVAYLGLPQAEVREFTARAGSGQALLQGGIEVRVPYAGADGKERTVSLQAPLRCFVAAAEARPQQDVEVRANVESVEAVRIQAGTYEVRVLCSFELRFTLLEVLELTTGFTSSQTEVETTLVEIEELVGENQYDQLLEPTIRLKERAEVLGEVTALPGKKEVKVTYGRVLVSGELEVCAYYITGDGRELCETGLIPWQTVLAIPEARPEMAAEVEAAAHVLPVALSPEGNVALAKVLLTIKASVYARTAARVVTGLAVTSPSLPPGRPVQGVIRDEMELEVLVLLPHLPAQKVEEAVATIARVAWEAEDGAVSAVGEFDLYVTYSGRDHLLRRWQERRPFAVCFPCAAARPGLAVCGGLKIKEVKHQLLLVPGARSGREVVTTIILAADLVLLGD